MNPLKKGEKKARENGSQWKLCAILRRGKSPIRIVSNTSTLHAEERALKWAQKGDVLEVYRWSRKTGRLTMARPCEYCAKLLDKSPIAVVYYSNWSGNIERMKL